jgi:hypothetical protein
MSYPPDTAAHPAGRLHGSARCRGTLATARAPLPPPLRAAILARGPTELHGSTGCDKLWSRVPFSVYDGYTLSMKL